MHASVFLLLSFLISPPAIAESERIPSVIFHFNPKRHLLENARADTIPKKVWDEVFIGRRGEGLYTLPSYRKGLYGSSEPGFAEYFGAKHIGTREKPWFMTIHIEPECLTTGSALSVRTLKDNKTFVRWLEGKDEKPFYTWENFFSNCSDSGELSFIETNCEQILGLFVEHQDYKVVEDWEWTESWYIRDRACIRQIDGSPVENLKLMAQREGFWRQFPLGPRAPERTTYGSLPFGSGIFVILVDILSEITPEALSSDEWDVLLATIQTSDISSSYPHALEEKQTYRIDFESPWLARVGKEIVSAFLRCEGNALFQERLDGFARRLNPPTELEILPDRAIKLQIAIGDLESEVSGLCL